MIQYYIFITIIIIIITITIIIIITIFNDIRHAKFSNEYYYIEEVEKLNINLRYFHFRDFYFVY